MSEKIGKIKKTRKEVSEIIFSNFLNSEINSESFFKNAYLDDFKIIYVPMYDARIDYHARWSAAFGFDRTEHYTEYVRVPISGTGVNSYRMEPRTKTKTVTDWKVRSGQSSGSLRMFSYAGKSHPTAGGLAEQITVAPKSLAVKFDPGSEVESETVSSNEWSSKNKYKIESDIKSSVIQKNKQGDRQRDWRIISEFSAELDKFFIPLYSANIYYNGKAESLYILPHENCITNYNFSLDDDLGYLEKNKTGIFWFGVSAFALVSLINIWAIACGFIFAFIHWFVMENSKDESSQNYSEILKDRIREKGFIGSDSINAEYSEMKDIFWRSKRGYQYYFLLLGILLTLPIVGLAIGVGGGRSVHQQAALAPIEEGDWQAEPVPAPSRAIEATGAADETKLGLPNPSELEAGGSREIVSGTEIIENPQGSQPMPSFNCAVATTPSEKLICSSSELAELDVEMARLYQIAVARADAADAAIGRTGTLNRATLVGDQRLWIHQGNLNCRDHECVKQRMLDRIKFLRSYSPG